MIENDKNKISPEDRIVGDKNTTGIDPNTVLIPREMSERRKLLATQKLNLPSLTPEQSAELRRFEIIPTNPISHEEEYNRIMGVSDGDGENEEDDKETGKNEKKKPEHKHAADPTRARYGTVCPQCGQPQGSGRVSKITVTGENYLHLYMEQQKQTQEDQQKMNDSPDVREAQERAAERERQLRQTYRARELREQITYWEQQRGQGQYDDGTITSQIDSLTYELGTIPSNLW